MGGVERVMEGKHGQENQELVGKRSRAMWRREEGRQMQETRRREERAVRRKERGRRWTKNAQ